MASNGKVFYSPQIKKIILFMAKYYKENECYPKLDEIGKALNVSKQRIGILIKDAEKLIEEQHKDKDHEHSEDSKKPQKIAQSSKKTKKIRKK